MLWIGIGISNAVILYLLWKDISFKVKCRELRNSREGLHSKNLKGDFYLRNDDFTTLAVRWQDEGLMGIYLYNGEFWSAVKNKKLIKFCKKELKTYVLEEYTKLKQEGKLKKQKKKEFEFKIVNDGFK